MRESRDVFEVEGFRRDVRKSDFQFIVVIVWTGEQRIRNSDDKGGC